MATLKELRVISERAVANTEALREWMAKIARRIDHLEALEQATQTGPSSSAPAGDGTAERHRVWPDASLAYDLALIHKGITDSFKSMPFMEPEFTATWQDSLTLQLTLRWPTPSGWTRAGRRGPVTREYEGVMVLPDMADASSRAAGIPGEEAASVTDSEREWEDFVKDMGHASVRAAQEIARLEADLAAARKRIEELEHCPHCDGSGLVDSGGFTPWGEPINVPCACRGQTIATWKARAQAAEMALDRYRAVLEEIREWVKPSSRTALEQLISAALTGPHQAAQDGAEAPQASEADALATP